MDNEFVSVNIPKELFDKYCLNCEYFKNPHCNGKCINEFIMNHS